MADTAHRLTDEKLEEMEKRLSAIYSRAEKEIQKTADEYFSKFAKQDEAKRKLLEQGKITEEEYTKWRKGKVMYDKRFAEMKEQCAKQLLNVNQTAIAYINGELPEVYAINYNAIESAVDGVGGYSFTLVDADTVRNLAVTDTSLLPYKNIDPAKDIPWNMKKINAETLQGILQGESMDKIAKRMMNVQEMNKTQAIRSARTIVTGAECKGRQDSYQRAKNDGIILRKYWLATYDKRARDWHKEAGNDYTEEKAIDIDDFFIVDGEKMLHPGDAMHGASGHNLYNCRCSIASKVIGFKKAQVQKAMAEKQVEEPKPQKPIEYQNPTSEDYSNLGKASRKNVSKEDQEQIFKHDGGGYVATHNYSTINSNLRKDGYTGNPLTDDDKKTISALDRAISKTQTDKDYVFTRYVNADYLTTKFGIHQIGFHGEQNTISNMILEFSNSKKQVPRITKELQKFIGTDDIDPAFLSTSMLPDKNIMKSKSVLIKIKAPKGTDVYVPKNRKESECIFGRGVKRTIESVEFDEQQNKWIITEVISNG